jgi:enterochelin esterase-like enzyme
MIICCLVVFTSCKQKESEVEKPITKEVESEMLFQKVDTAKIASGTLLRVEKYPSNYIVPRPVDVWLPENYSEDKTCDVLYMHDGQMLFDSTTTWNKQEWKVDEWASKLMSTNKTKDFIVVAVHNIPELRWEDLFPEKAMGFLSEEELKTVKDISNRADYTLNGNNYLRFIVEELKPEIDKSFSTKTDASHTFVMGSSMGGLMSMYALSEYPNVFGGAACLSTHWPGAVPSENQLLPNAIFKYMEINLPNAGKHKLYFDYGNQTLDAYYPQYGPRVDAILQAKGYTDKDSKNLFFEGTDHSENSWNKRLDQPLRFLLGR